MTTTQQRVITPTTGRMFKRALFWIGAAVFVLLIAVISIGIAAPSIGGPPLDSDNPGPAGSMAVAEVLRQQGVTVTATSTLKETREAISDPASTTLFIYDHDLFLNASQLRDAVGLAEHVIIAEPSFSELRTIAPEVAQAGIVAGELDADCDLTAVTKAGTVSGGGYGYRVTDEDADAVSCLGSGDGAYSLIELRRETGRLSILGASGALTNEFVINNGNAAFALNLLGENDTLLWYIPSFQDLPQGGPQTMAELTPGWVNPVLILLVISFIAAAVWRGRRFGPLVVENLPVTVRASETMLGRARLYQKSSSRLRALDALRIGSIQRLAALCGLPRVASLDDVIAAVASVTAAQPGGIRALLVDARPLTDRDLIEASDSLLTLERDVARAVRP